MDKNKNQSLTNLNNECDFCSSFARAKKINRWSKFDLPFKQLCLKHEEKVNKSPDLLKINEEAKRIIKPWPKLMFGSDCYGKIRFKSYLKDLPGVTPLTFWTEEYADAWQELNKMVMDKPPLKKTLPKKKKNTRNKNYCVCSLSNKIAILFGSKLEGEIFFKHSSNCSTKTTGTYEWTGINYKEISKK